MESDALIEVNAFVGLTCVRSFFSFAFHLFLLGSFYWPVGVQEIAQRSLQKRSQKQPDNELFFTLKSFKKSRLCERPKTEPDNFHQFN